MRISLSTLVEALDDVPAMPEAVARPVRQAEGGGAHLLTALAALKPAISAQIPLLANSALYGSGAAGQPSAAVASTAQAVSRHGCAAVRAMAIGLWAIGSFSREQRHISIAGFWLHGLVAAGLCRSLAVVRGGCDPELAFATGLLTGIGKLILLQHLPEPSAAIIRIASSRKLRFAQAARRVIDTDEAEVGGWLCQRWGLDAALVDAIRCQNEIARSTVPDLVAMGMLVDHLCAVRGLRSPGDCDQPVLDQQVWSHLRIEKEACKEIIAAMPAMILSARDLLTAVW